MKKKEQTLYCCQSCNYQTPKWMGKCPDCGQWDTLVEKIKPKGKFKDGSKQGLTGGLEPIPINSIKMEREERTLTGIGEFDRVLGGGLVDGSLVLIGGDPGIGKSTLMLQVVNGIANKGKKVFYISGEESIRQIKLRSKRLSVASDNLFIISEIDLDLIITSVTAEKPDVIVIDSMQTMYIPDVTSAPGSVTQVRESTMRLMIMAKKTNLPIFLVGHVTKDGAIAGPRIMEHMVDTVLYFEGDKNHIFRILRAVKNRFGSTNEIGVFEMRDKGLSEVATPSAIFLAERPENTPGSTVIASMEGTRPILIELQGLVSSTNLGTPRRTILGLDANRVALLIAVMEKKLGMNLNGLDIFMNVAGGIKVIEPAIDMGIIASIASSFLDRAIPEGTVVLGEVGLTGEVRAISHIENRVSEIKKMGFTQCLIPKTCLKRISNPLKKMKITGIETVANAMEFLF